MRATLFIVGLAVLGAPVLARDPLQTNAAWRDPSPHHVRWITVDSSIRLEVLDWKGSGPPLVLLGCYLSAHSYDEFAPKLTNQFHVYGMTRRGIGAYDTGIRVPVLAIYQAQRPFEEVAAEHDIRSEQQRAALRQQYTAIRVMYTRWQQDLLARIVELPGANIYMFATHEADVLREIRAFAATLPK